MNLYIRSLILILVLQIALPAGATAPTACVANLLGIKPYTLRSLEEESNARVAAATAKTPLPGFFHLHQQTEIEQVGVSGPNAMQQLLAPGISFVATPAPTAPNNMVVSLTDTKESFALHVDMPWAGRRTSTTVFASVPGTMSLNPHGYVVGPEHKVAIFHLHGGGTPSATGKNAMSIGEALSKSGVPVLGIDLPGHGQATRALDGLTTMEGQVDWILALIDKLIDPSVKVIISGHSWGGEFAVHMHQHSNEPKYKRIARFISMSPPIDVSLGGDAATKVKFEEDFEKRLPEFEDRIAPTDYGFLMNVVANGKIADVPGYYTMFTNFDYHTPPLTVEEQKHLKPMLLIVGESDGLVFVGREKEFLQFTSSYVAPSRALILGPGQTFRSKGTPRLEPTGHGIFDRYIDGTSTLQVYSLIAAEAAEVAGEKQPLPEADLARTTVDQLLRNYANYFAFRSFIEKRVEYVRRSTPDATTLTNRKNEILAYLKANEARETAAAKEIENAVRTALENLRAELGLEKALSLERAQYELALKPLDDNRRARLKAYADAAAATDTAMQAEYKDAQTPVEMAKLETEFAGLMQQFGWKAIAEYKPAFERYRTMKNPDKAAAAVRAQLSLLQQKFMEVTRLAQERYGRERDRRIALLSRPEDVTDPRDASRQLAADRSPERLQKLKDFTARYSDVEASAHALAQAKVDETAQHAPHPEGITSAAQARDEYNRINSLFELDYAPPGEPEIAQLVEEIRAFEKERLEIQKGSETVAGVEKTFKTLKGLRDRRKTLTDTWTSLWETHQDLATDAIIAARHDVDDQLINYTTMNRIFDKKKSEALLSFKEAGHLDAPHIKWLSESLEADLNRMLDARAHYLASVVNAEKITWLEALAGHLHGEAAAQAQRLAQDLVGVSYLVTEIPSPESLVGQIKVLDDHYDAQRRRESLLTQQKEAAIWEYLKLMTDKGQPVPYTFEKVALDDSLALGIDELLNELRSKPAVLEAFQRTLKAWSEFSARIREDDQRKSGGIE